MISIGEALAIIEENRPEPTLGRRALLDAHGRRLAEDIRAPEASPRYTNSAMDGYAVRWSDICDVQAGQPAVLSIAGESQAGIPFTGQAGAGQAVRISTGAMLPAGCDTVVRVEDTENGGKEVRILRVRESGQDVRRMGEEFQVGDLLLTRGTVLQAPHLALLAGVGIGEVLVVQPPQVAVVVTGTELVGPGQEAAPHQIRDSNSLLLTAAVLQVGGDVTATLRAADSLAETTAAIREASEGAGIILVSGGVSVGPHDHVKEAAAGCGFSELFWRVQQKPGKPLFVARKEDRLLFGLPGNPVSAFMCFMYYVQPVLRSLEGRDFSWRTVRAPLTGAIRNSSKRTNFYRVRMEKGAQGLRAELLGKQGSHMLGSIAGADGFIIVDPGGAYAPGDLETVYLFPGRK